MEPKPDHSPDAIPGAMQPEPAAEAVGAAGRPLPSLDPAAGEDRDPVGGWRPPHIDWKDLWSRRAVRISAIAGGALIAAGVIGWNLLFAGMPRLPPADQLWSLNRKPSVQFVDAGRRLIAARGPRYGEIVHAADLPPYVGQAFIAAEDQRFLEHGGVDLQSVTRAALANVSAGHTQQGGSTITQQLVKNILLDDKRTLRRKAQEARLASEMEKKLTKEQILDLYLNRVYLGSNAYGIEAAAQTYFGVAAADLTLGQAAFLGALPKAPSRYAEHKTDPEVAERRRYVLDQMVEAGFITSQAAAKAKAQPLKFVDDTAQAGMSGYVLDAAMEEAHRALPNLPPDAVIELTVDRGLQRAAERSLEAALRVRGLGASEGAVVVMDPFGAVKALVGGRDYQKSQFNRVTQAKRQPGSVFKTFVYAAALEQGLQPSDVRDDAPVSIGAWQPRNYEDSYRGPITLARALAVSSNSVAAQVGSEVGPRRVADLARRFGIGSPLSAYPSIALGSDEVTLYEITGAYGVLANGGVATRPHLVSEIRDLRGEILYAAPPASQTQVYPQTSVETLTGMLSNVVRFGTGGLAQVPGWEIAGKTGTSQSWRDAWFVGYSARYVAGVWIGNDDEKAMKHVTGGSAAAALFSSVMKAAHRGQRPQPLPGAELGEMWLDGGFDDGFPIEDMVVGDDAFRSDGMPEPPEDEPFAEDEEAPREHVRLADEPPDAPSQPPPPAGVLALSH